MAKVLVIEELSAIERHRRQRQGREHVDRPRANLSRQTWALSDDGRAFGRRRQSPGAAGFRYEMKLRRETPPQHSRLIAGMAHRQPLESFRGMRVRWN
jgi:hypothetical protein